MNVVRRLAVPRLARVLTQPDGSPRAVEDREVEAILETWLLEDRWWTDEPLRRRYWEVVTIDGANRVVFHDLTRNDWWSQR